MRILIVEDEADLADFVVRGLREDGFTVEHALDSAQGTEALESGVWDLIVLDWGLPGEDGISFLRRFRHAGGTTPVLFLTARDSVADRVRGLDIGADDYLCKPFAFDELLARVRALVRRRDRVPDIWINYGDVSIDIAKQRALRAGHTLDLTAKELALLTFFLRHPAQVLSRTRIYDHVWDENFDLLSNTLEVHIMELRRKLEAHGPRLIQTIRGRGYLFDVAPGSEAK
ncbi:MAG TPA: response regulator transcription factor [Isosphaeraceae bacterium]|nr:response regulator transcription factor [Isosphaeraceae bacterium]